jgi:hypothetical protein
VPVVPAPGSPLVQFGCRDGSSERWEELREAARQIAAGEGVGLEGVAVDNDRPVPVVAQQIVTWLGWL